MKNKILIIFMCILLVSSAFSIASKVEAEKEVNFENEDFNIIINNPTFLANIIGKSKKIDFGNGSDGDVIISNNTILSRDMNYANLTVLNNVILDTRGFLIKVKGTLTNNGTITDMFSGGDGGEGGAGGQGGDPLEDSGGPEYPQHGTCGQNGSEPYVLEAGFGGNGSGGGGGGGGAWWWLSQNINDDADGGDGGNGGFGGHGGGYVRINAYNFNNQPDGLIHADGGKGVNGQNGQDGKYQYFYVGVSKDLAGGGGGGGAGGNGGNGGTVEIYYANNISKGEIHANGGNGGNRGLGGNGQQCLFSTIDGHADNGSYGVCGGGDGGRGEYRAYHWSEDGDPSDPSTPGADGTVIFQVIPSQPPVISNPNPANGSTNISISTSIVSVNIYDPDGHTFDWSIQTSPDIGSNGSSYDINGTKICDISGLDYNMNYTWYVNATDTGGGGNTTSVVYIFTTISNSPPSFSYETPSDGETNVNITIPQLSVFIYDIDEDHFNWWINCSNGDNSSAYNDIDGIKICDITDHLNYSTTYTWIVTAVDINGSGQTTTENYTFTTGPFNSPPEISNEVPENGSTGVPVSLNRLRVLISDPEGNPFSWSIQTNPDVGSNSSSYDVNGTKTCDLDSLQYGTLYKWTVTATDLTTEMTTEKNYTFTTNYRPNKPTITGPIEGKAGQPYEYSVKTTDNDGDNIYYYIDWDDGTNSGWIGPYNSGDEITKSHTWSEEGTYTIQAKAKDTNGAESTWGTLTVSMPHNKLVINTVIMQLLKRFGNIFPNFKFLNDLIFLYS